jgi:hypothetical protein
MPYLKWYPEGQRKIISRPPVATERCLAAPLLIRGFDQAVQRVDHVVARQSLLGGGGRKAVDDGLNRGFPAGIFAVGQLQDLVAQAERKFTASGIVLVPGFAMDIDPFLADGVKNLLDIGRQFAPFPLFITTYMAVV